MNSTELSAISTRLVSTRRSKTIRRNERLCTNRPALIIIMEGEGRQEIWIPNFFSITWKLENHLAPSEYPSSVPTLLTVNSENKYLIKLVIQRLHLLLRRPNAAEITYVFRLNLIPYVTTIFNAFDRIDQSSIFLCSVMLNRPSYWSNCLNLSYNESQ